jgi:hypothetical protein
VNKKTHEVSFTVQITEDNREQLATMCLMSYGRAQDVEAIDAAAIPYLAIANQGVISMGYLQDFVVIRPSVPEITFKNAREYRQEFEAADGNWFAPDWSMTEEPISIGSTLARLDRMYEDTIDKYAALMVYVDLRTATIQRNIMWHEAKAKEMFDHE